MQRLLLPTSPIKRGNYMAKIVECIPNFSEGRNQAVIDGLVATAKSIPGVTLLDYSSDASHNRSVFTLVGDEEAFKK